MESGILSALGIDPGIIIILLFLLIIALFVLYVNVTMKYNRLKSSYNTFMKGKDGKTLEERHISVARGGRRVYERQPQRPQADRPARRPAARPKRSGARRAFWGFYKFLVVISALIVAVYVGLTLWVRPPAQTDYTPPGQTGQGQAAPGTGTGTGTEVDENALVRREYVYNILVAAADEGGTRTDTMIVVNYDVPNQKVGAVSVPRDTLVNRSSGNPKLVYGSGGVEQRVEDISNLLGVPIDYYVKVDVDGFIALVDYLDGVDFYVPCDMDYDDPIQGLSIHYEEGMQPLTGQQAMEVCRFRKNNPDENGHSTGYSDVGRTQTQQNMLMALARKIISWNSITRVNGFVEIFNDYVDTDLSLSDMLYFASQAISVDLDGVEMLTLEGDGNTTYKGVSYCYALDPQSTLEAVNRLINPYTRELTLEDMDIIQP